MEEKLVENKIKNLNEKEKIYFWIKLKTDFFNREEIDFLLSQKNGCEYIVLYQMLCVNTANNKGEMSSKVGEMLVKYNPEKISRDTKYFDVDTVIVALELYKKLGLIYEGNNNTLTISNYDDMVGSETNWAEKKRLYREQLELKKIKDKERTLSDKRLEIRDKSIEYRDIELDIDNNTIIYFNNKDINNLFIEFLKLRKKIKATNSKKAISILINELNKYTDDEKIWMLNNAIVNSWKSVYPRNQNNNNKRSSLEILGDL